MRAICPEGPSVVIDTTGVPDLVERGLDVAAPRGRIVLVGVLPVGYVVGMQGLGFVEVCFLWSPCMVRFARLFGWVGLVIETGLEEGCEEKGRERERERERRRANGDENPERKISNGMFGGGFGS